MERVPEPELMEDDAQARAYAAADFVEPHERCIVLLREGLPRLRREGRALDLGCGPADVTIRFARAFPGWRVAGVDGSAAMLRYGRAAVARAGLADRVALRQVYLPDGSTPGEGYDLILSNSLLHHLTDPQVLWSSVRCCSGDGAHVFVMDLLRPASRVRAQALVAEYAAGEPEVLRRDFFHSLLAAYRVAEVEAQLAAAGLGQLAVRQASDRHLIVWGRL
jgi:SAM-dependent methyltransferase